MAAVCKGIALLQTLAISGVLGFRVHSPKEVLAEFKAEVKRWSFDGKPHMICGGSAIWNLLSGPSSDAENIDWGKVESYEKTYLDQQSSEKVTVEKKLSALQQRLDKALKDESLPSTGTAQHKTLIKAGVEVFGGLDAAHTFGCGKPAKRGPNGERLKVRGAFRKAVDAFSTASSSFFGKKEYRLDGVNFLMECHALLVKGEADDKVSHCPRFCQRMKDIAQKDSFEAVGEVAKTSDEIKDEMEELRRLLTKIVNDIEQCTSDSSSLSAFKDQLAGMVDMHEKCYNAWADAEQGLDDALWSMEDLEEEVSAAEEAAAAGEKLLEQSKGVTADAKTALKDANTKEKALLGKVTALEKDFREMSADVSAALTATSLIGKLKELVVATMMRMEMYFDAGVREPIKNIGFTEDPSDVGFPEVQTLESAGVLKQALTNMYDYCEQSAKPAFAETLELMPGLDFSPLCGFENADGMFTDLTAQVDKRKDLIKKDILAVVGWLNPWKDFSDVPLEAGRKKELELVKGGQLMYLEQVKPIYKAPTNEFWKYLIGWRKDGPHNKLTIELSETLAALKAKEEAMMKALLDMDAAYAASREATALAKKDLAAALEKEAASGEEVEGLKEALEELQTQQSKLQDDIAAWREKVAKALKAMNKAKATLDDAYTEGIAIILGEFASWAWSKVKDWWR